MNDINDSIAIGTIIVVTVVFLVGVLWTYWNNRNNSSRKAKRRNEFIIPDDAFNEEYESDRKHRDE